MKILLTQNIITKKNLIVLSFLSKDQKNVFEYYSCLNQLILSKVFLKLRKKQKEKELSKKLACLWK